MSKFSLPIASGKPAAPAAQGSIHDQIQAIIDAHPIVLFMKGTPDMPQCGFSARAANILQSFGKPVHGVNILADPELRQGIKDFSDWPTIPQIYVKGEFLGGSDILTEMYQNGELQKLIAAI